MRSAEANEQVTVIQFCDFRKIPVFHIPNGGSRNKIEAANLKRQGVRAGVPDLCIPLARKGYHGLYIEMKAGKGKPTENQKEWLALLNENGYLAKVCVGAYEAIDLINWYIKE